MKLTKALSRHFLTFRLNPINRIIKTAPIIGFDFGREKLNMVQIGFRSGRPIVLAAASDYHNTDIDKLFENQDSLKKLIKNVLIKRKFNGRKVVSSLPSHFLKLLFLNYQIGKNESDEESLLSALTRRVSAGLDDYVIDYLPVKPDAIERNERMALVAMVKQDIVEQYLDLLSACGLDVVTLEIGPVAIRRLVNEMARTDKAQKVLTVNFGTEKSYLTVIWNNELLFDRKIDFGIETIIAVVARAFNVPVKTAMEILNKYGLTQAKQPLLFDELSDIEIDDDDDSINNVLYDILNPSIVKLATEIRDIMIYIASETRGGAIEQIYLMGSLARLSGIDDVIEKQMSTPVKSINPFFGIEVDDVPNTLNDLGPVAGLAVATGMALRRQN